MTIEAIVTNIISSLVYDIGKTVAKKKCSDTQEEKLREALNWYLEKLKEKYEQDGDMLISNIPFPNQNGQLYQEILLLRANEKEILKTWMDRCEPELRDRLRPICIDCINIIIDNIKRWPEFNTDLSLSIDTKVAEIHRDTKRATFLLEDLKTEANQVQTPVAVKSRTSEYKNRWKEALFLNDPSRHRDIKRICPEDTFISHRYLLGDESKPSDELKYPLMDELAKNGGHLVLGDPGIGKSTLISWYLNKSCDTRTMHVYRLTDFEFAGIEEQPGNFLLRQMGVNPNQLSNTIFFLDGLDECGFTPEGRIRFLRELHNDWLYLSKMNVSWIVTCRLNYISAEKLRTLRIPRITLLPLNAEQIGLFLQQYETAVGKSIPEEKRSAVLSKKNTGKFGGPFGIPLILYLAIASDIAVKEDNTLVDVYDKLFSALYQRSATYDTYEQEIVFLHHEEIHQMSRDIALWMLLHKSQAASITEAAYEEIENAFGGVIAAEHAHQIGSYFRSLHHTEGKAELCFIHRTMFEYFVADGFVHRAINAKTVEELSGIISWYWYADQMEETIQQYVIEKLRQQKDALNYTLWEAAGQRIVEKGIHRSWQVIFERSADTGEYLVPNCLLPFSGDSLEDDRRSENIAFWNLCHLLTWVQKIKGIRNRIFKQNNNSGKALSRAIRHCSADYFPIYCPAFSLTYASLSRTVLSHATLTNADLSGAHLSFVDLTEADLRRANLSRASIDSANLTGALLSKEQVQMLGYDTLSQCHFGSIKISSSSSDYIEYPRKQFFAKFFPKRKYPGNKK